MSAGYTYVIIEDEPTVRKGTRLKMESTGLNFSLVGEAGDGRSGHALIRETKPDLALVDMRMPAMDGARLMRMLREEGSAVRFIIISGHSEFSYAQEGINAGAAAYLLKPFTDVELKEALIKVMESMNGASQLNAKDDGIQRAHEALLSVLSGAPYDDASEEGLRTLGIASSAGTWLAAEAHAENGVELLGRSFEPIGAEADCVPISLPRRGAQKFSYFVAYIRRPPRGGDEMRFADWLGARIEDGQAFSIGVGQAQPHIGQLYSAAEQAHRARMGMPLVASRYIGIHGNPPGDARVPEEQTLIERMRYCLEAGDATWFMQTFEQYLYTCERQGATLTHVLSVCRGLVEKLLAGFALLGRPSEASLYQYDYMIRQIQGVEHGKQCISSFFANTFCLGGDSDGSAAGAVFAARRYVSGHYTEDLSLDRLADIFGVSSSYLSSQFKARLGINFNAYLISLRIQHAKQLLSGTNYSIPDIAARSGFLTDKYFYRLFKQKVGMTPQTYRQQHARSYNIE